MVGKMRKILKIASVILLGLILLMNTGCSRKGSRAWVENQISDIERVYPTENAEDLFEKFPNGFRVSQTRVFEENGQEYSIDLEMVGDKNTKKIVGKVSKSRIKKEPYKEIIEKESEVEYKKGENLVLAKPELTEELLPRNYFLFQKIKLNKEVLNNWRFINKEYSFETGVFDIKYNVIDSEISNYFNIDRKTELKVDLGGVDLSAKDSYKYSLTIENKENNINYYEIISNSKEDIKNEE